MFNLKQQLSDLIMGRYLNKSSDTPRFSGYPPVGQPEGYGSFQKTIDDQNRQMDSTEWLRWFDDHTGNWNRNYSRMTPVQKYELPQSEGSSPLRTVRSRLSNTLFN